MFKKIICLLLVLFALSIPLTAFSESEASAFLSSVTTEKNKLFDTYLSVNTEVAACVATLEFDESNLEFREAKALSESSEISVNSSDAGKVTLAFLNENGTEGEILKFTFKSKTENAFISLNLEQVIDKNAQDITLTSVKGADINITEKAVNKSEGNKEDAENKASETSALSESKDELTLNIPAKETATVQKIIFVSLGALLLVAVGVTGFILGRKSNIKNKNRKNNYEKNS